MVAKSSGHKLVKCEDSCPGCIYCEEGVERCTVCGGCDESLTIHCPGRRLGPSELAAVRDRLVTYVHGFWKSLTYSGS
jgi:hypothetical protein